jgi:hypothetical protein
MSYVIRSMRSQSQRGRSDRASVAAATELRTFKVVARREGHENIEALQTAPALTMVAMAAEDGAAGVNVCEFVLTAKAFCGTVVARVDSLSFEDACRPKNAAAIRQCVATSSEARTDSHPEGFGQFVLSARGALITQPALTQPALAMFENLVSSKEYEAMQDALVVKAIRRRLSPLSQYAERFSVQRNLVRMRAVLALVLAIWLLCAAASGLQAQVDADGAWEERACRIRTFAEGTQPCCGVQDPVCRKTSVAAGALTKASCGVEPVCTQLVAAQQTARNVSAPRSSQACCSTTARSSLCCTCELQKGGVCGGGCRSARRQTYDACREKGFFEHCAHEQSTFSEKVICDTCHSFQIGVQFAAGASGRQHNRTYRPACGLPDSGFVEPGCPAHLRAAFGVGSSKACWVNLQFRDGPDFRWDKPSSGPLRATLLAMCTLQLAMAVLAVWWNRLWFRAPGVLERAAGSGSMWAEALEVDMQLMVALHHGLYEFQPHRTLVCDAVWRLLVEGCCVMMPLLQLFVPRLQLVGGLTYPVRDVPRAGRKRVGAAAPDAAAPDAAAADAAAAAADGAMELVDVHVSQSSDMSQRCSASAPPSSSSGASLLTRLSELGESEGAAPHPDHVRTRQGVLDMYAADWTIWSGHMPSHHRIVVAWVAWVVLLGFFFLVTQIY